MVLTWVIFAGQVIEGNCASLTVTVKEQVAELFAAFTARNVTVVVPTGKFAPEARPPVCVMVGEAVQLSDAVTLPNVMALSH